MNPSDLPKKLVGSEEERAVSPVIGVILMVAITVILAAVIAAFVLDIGPGDSTLSAAADVSQGEENDSVVVEITSGGGDMDGLALVNSSGEVVDVKDEGVNTGGSYDLSHSELEEEDEHTVYGFSGSVSPGGSIDDADAHAALGSVELSEENGS